MRSKILDNLFIKMQSDKKIFFLIADMGINLVEKFEQKYPDRFANVGIAEQNLIGISAGLMNLGFKAFTYTISNFTITRCLEQIRNDIAIHDYPLTILGTSTGYDNAPLGPTHHIIDEWGTLKSIPNFNIYCPSTLSYANKLIDIVLDQRKPSYIRIPKGNFDIEGFDIEGGDQDYYYKQSYNSKKILISYGSIAWECLKAQKIENKFSVLILNKLHPLDSIKIEINKILNLYDSIIIAEDHFPQSGIYSSICQLMMENQIFKKTYSISPSNYTLEVGNSPEFFKKKFGLDSESLIRYLRLI